MKVNFGALDTASADIQNSANQVQGRLDQLDRELAPLRSDWTGSASEAYQVAKAQWTQAMVEMQQVLAQIGTAVGTSNQNYQSAERANTSRWG